MSMTVSVSMWVRAGGENSGDYGKKRGHPERSVTESKDPGGSIKHGTFSDRRGPSTAFRPASARTELRSG